MSGLVSAERSLKRVDVSKLRGILPVRGMKGLRISRFGHLPDSTVDEACHGGHVKVFFLRQTDLIVAEVTSRTLEEQSQDCVRRLRGQ